MSDEVTRVQNEAEVDPGADPVAADPEPDAEVDLETPQADAVEQRQAVPLDEEDYR